LDILFWMVEFEDGFVITEFDLDTGERHSYSEVENYGKKIKRVFWLPYRVSFVKKIKEKPLDDPIPTWLPHYELVIPDNAKVINPHRNVKIIHETKIKCLKCGNEFTEINETRQRENDTKHEILVVCPNCGAIDSFECPECGYLSWDLPHLEVCPKCNKKQNWKYKRFIINIYSDYMITYYKVGYELNGKKVMMTINEKGNVKVE